MKSTLQELQNTKQKILLESQGLIINEPRFIEERIYYQSTKASLSATAFFTTKPVYLLSIINGTKDQGELVCFEGIFNCDEIVNKICGIVIGCFEELTFRHKRRIILDFGNLLVRLMKNYDESPKLSACEEEVLCRIGIEQYEVLGDVDWIEEKMDEWYRTQGQSNYPMVPFN